MVERRTAPRQFRVAKVVAVRFAEEIFTWSIFESFGTFSPAFPNLREATVGDDDVCAEFVLPSGQLVCSELDPPIAPC